VFDRVEAVRDAIQAALEPSRVTPKEPRHPHVCLGAARERAEMIVKRFNASTSPDSGVLDCIDAQAILELLAECDEAVTNMMLGASLAQKGSDDNQRCIESCNQAMG